VKRVIFASIALAAITIWFVAGCSPKSGAFGQPINETKITAVKDILGSPAQFKGKTVLVKGNIIEECPAGGWFMLKDDTGVIYVNLHPSYFAIPQAVGRKASAQGKVTVEYAQVSIIGEGVEIK